MVSARWGTLHTSTNTLLWLTQPSEDRLISRRCDIEWAPHSPELNPAELYLWGCLKDRVYENNPQKIGELKTAITARIRAVPIEECFRVNDNFARLLQVCLQHQGVVCNTLWRKHTNRTIWPTKWKLCRMIMQKLKIICNNNEVIRWNM